MDRMHGDAFSPSANHDLAEPCVREPRSVFCAGAALRLRDGPCGRRPGRARVRRHGRPRRHAQCRRRSFITEHLLISIAHRPASSSASFDSRSSISQCAAPRHRPRVHRHAPRRLLAHPALHSTPRAPCLTACPGPSAVMGKRKQTSQAKQSSITEHALPLLKKPMETIGIAARRIAARRVPFAPPRFMPPPLALPICDRSSLVRAPSRTRA